MNNNEIILQISQLYNSLTKEQTEKIICKLSKNEHSIFIGLAYYNDIIKEPITNEKMINLLSMSKKKYNFVINNLLPKIKKYAVN